MKIVSRVHIDRPLKVAMALMADSAHTSKWMHDLASATPPSAGRPAQLTFKHGQRNTVFDLYPLPSSQSNELCSKLEGRSVTIVTKAQFSAVAAKTELTFTQDFRFKGLGKVLAFIVRPAIHKQQQKHMQDFKDFVENHE